MKTLIRLATLLTAIVGCQVFVLSAQAATADSDFAAVCSDPNVIKCVNFDTDKDFDKGRGGTQGAYGSNFGLFPPYGTSDYTRATRDTTQAAAGGSSLRFTIPSNTASDTSGAWFTNFSDDLSVQMGEGQEVYVQWRQRFSPEFLNTQYTGIDNQALGNGWKMLDVSAGDLPGCTPSTANTTYC